MANVLGELFTDIASAIRDLTGESSSVKRKPTEFANKIREVAESGGTGSGDSGDADISELKMTSGTFTPNTASIVLTSVVRSFSQNTTYEGYYYWESSPAAFVLETGVEYSVNFAGLFRNCEATQSSRLGGVDNCIALGNTSLLTGGDGEPFLILYSASEDKTVVYTKHCSTEIAVGIVKSNPQQITIEHGLGKVPDFVMVYYSGLDLQGNITSFVGQTTSIWGFNSKFASVTETLSAFSAYGSSGTSAYGLDNMPASEKSSGYIFCDDDNTFTLGDVSDNLLTHNLLSGQTYNWIAMSGLCGDIIVEDDGGSESSGDGLGYALLSRDASFTSGDKTFLDVSEIRNAEGTLLASINSYAFAGFISITHARTKSTVYFQDNAFVGDAKLKLLDITCSETIGILGFYPNALTGCSALESVIIRRWPGGTAINQVIFNTGSTTGAGEFYVYVPSADYDTIIANLSTTEVPADRFRKLEEYPELNYWDKTYTVKFWDGDTLVGEEVVHYGETASCSYTPAGEKLIRWNPAPNNVTSNMDCYGLFAPVSFSDASWERIAEISELGYASEAFALGDEKEFSLVGPDGNAYTTSAVIVGFDHDVSSDGNTVGISCATKHLCGRAKYHTDSSLSDKDTTATTWDVCSLRTTLNNTTFLSLPENLQAVIKPVKKKFCYRVGATETLSIGETSGDKLWVPSAGEIGYMTLSDHTKPYTTGDGPAYANRTHFTRDSWTTPSGSTSMGKYYLRTIRASTANSWILSYRWGTATIYAGGGNDNLIDVIFGFCI